MSNIKLSFFTTKELNIEGTSYFYYKWVNMSSDFCDFNQKIQSVDHHQYMYIYIDSTQKHCSVIITCGLFSLH